jgi:CheY-like chemotaxis protein
MKLNYPDPNLPSIILVDDCEDDIFLMRHRLRAGGVAHPVVTFNTARDALAFLESTIDATLLPHLVFTDVRMHGEDGFELIRRVRANPRWDGMKLAVISYSNDPADLQRALALRVEGYLVKFPPPEILAEFVHHGPWFSLPPPAAVVAPSAMVARAPSRIDAGSVAAAADGRSALHLAGVLSV